MTEAEHEAAILAATRSIAALWDMTQRMPTPGSVARGSYGSGGLADDHAETDADTARLYRVVSLRREVTNELASWCRVVVEDLDLRKEIPDGLDVPAMCTFLQRWARWISGKDFGEDCSDELTGWARKVRLLAAPQVRDSISIGACPMTVGVDGEPVTCGTRVRITVDHVGDIRCPGCGTEDTFDGWVARMAGNEGPFTATQLLPILHRRLGIVVVSVTMRQWVKREVITPCGRDEHGASLFDLRDVLTRLAMREKTGA